MMRYSNRIFVALGFVILCAPTLLAQQNDSNLTPPKPQGKQHIALENTQATQLLLENFEERFAVMDSIVFHSPYSSFNDEPLLDPNTLTFIVNERVAEIDEVVDAQIAEMKSKTGLDIRGQTYIRPGRHISYDPDDPLVAYNSKIQAELEWNIFHSSIYKRASKIQELRLQGELRQLEYEKEALDETLFLQKNAVRYRYYGRLLYVLNVHSENLKLLMDTQMYLLQHGKISSDDLLKLIREQSEIERQLIAIKADSVVTEIPAAADVAYISVPDTTALMSCIRSEQRDLKKYALRKELLEVQRKNIDYLQTMDILPFARYSYYTRENAHNTYNIDVGVSFKIPLSAETAKKRKVIRAEENVVRYEQERAGQKVEREVTLILRELDNYNENIYGEFERMESLKRYLQMRIDSYNNVIGEYSRIDRLLEYNTYLQAWERMLAYAYQRDCKLIELQSYILAEPVSKFLNFQELR